MMRKVNNQTLGIIVITSLLAPLWGATANTEAPVVQKASLPIQSQYVNVRRPRALVQLQRPRGPAAPLKNFKPGLLFSLPNNDDETGSSPTTKFVRGGSSSVVVGPPIVGIITWFTSLSYFIVRNYKIAPWLVPMRLSKQVWVLIHAISNMLFTSGIVLSTIFEWRILSTRNPEVIHDWFTKVVSSIDTMIVLPSLTLAIISGFAQTALDYGSMAAAPKHIRSAIHILATFAIWWMATDLTTQESAKVALNGWYTSERNEKAKLEKGGSSTSGAGLAPTSLPKVLYRRRLSNVISCLFVFSLYGLMTLKPGHNR